MSTTILVRVLDGFDVVGSCCQMEAPDSLCLFFNADVPTSHMDHNGSRRNMDTSRSGRLDLQVHQHVWQSILPSFLSPAYCGRYSAPESLQNGDLSISKIKQTHASPIPGTRMEVEAYMTFEQHPTFRTTVVT
jgi:hypothetical protein